MTFVQFLFVAVTGYIAQFDKTRPPFFLTPNRVPLRRWVVNIVLFFGINVLNNHAFSYDISVPVHIILRSGGSITTMAVGYLYGKRYSRIQSSAVVLLTFGVILAAWADARSKVMRLCGASISALSYLRLIGISGGQLSASFRHRPGHPLRCPTSLSRYGTLHRDDIPTIRATVEREPVLLTHSLPASLSAVCAIHGP